MGVKKVLSETGHLLVVHWITASLLLLVGPAVSAWGLISANWSWPGAVAVTIVLIAAIISASVAIKLYRRSEPGKKAEWSPIPPDWNAPTERIFKQHYQNETVHLDGKEFWECTFLDVLFIFDGKRPTGMINCKYGLEGRNNPVRLKTGNPAIASALQLLHALKMFKDEGFSSELHKSGTR
jgi:hypothetical protein